MRNNKRNKELLEASTSSTNPNSNSSSDSSNPSSNTSSNQSSNNNINQTNSHKNSTSKPSTLNAVSNSTKENPSLDSNSSHITNSNQIANSNQITNVSVTTLNSEASPKRNFKQEFIDQAVAEGSVLALNLFPEQVIDDLEDQEKKVLEQAQKVQQAVRQNLNASKLNSTNNSSSHHYPNTTNPNLHNNLNLSKPVTTHTNSNLELEPVYPQNYPHVVPDAGSSLFGDLLLGNYKSFEHLITNQNSILINSLERAIDSCAKQIKSNFFVICGSDHAFVPQIMHTCVEFGDECGLEGNDILFLDMHDLIERIDINDDTHAQIKLPIKPLTILTNIQLAIGNHLWEKVLINLINQIQQANSTLIASSKFNLDRLSFYYSDLSSRFSRFQVYILQPESKQLIHDYIVSYSEQINLILAKRTLDLLVDMIYQDADIEIESTLECLLVLCLNLNIATNKLTCSQLRKHASEFILYEMIDW